MGASQRDIPHFLQDHVAYIGIGSNLGDKKGFCLQGLEELSEIEGITVEKRSSFYRSEPVGGPQQDWFVNAAARLRTTLSSRELLAALHLVERKLLRRRDVLNGPRTLDLDLLFYDEKIIDEEGLIVPHPAIQDRHFVLLPLSEIAPRLVHPTLNQTIRQLLKNLNPKTACSPLTQEDDLACQMTGAFV